MKKLFAMLLALCMACTMAFASAEDVSSLAVTADFGLTVDGDMVTALIGAAASGMEDAMGAVVELLNNLSAHGVATGKGAEGTLNLKGQPVVTFAGTVGEEGVNVVSNLFPSSVIVVSPETLEKLSSSVTGGLGDIDPEALMQAILPKLMAIGQEAMGRFGEPEEAAYTFQGTEFTTYEPLNMTLKEMALLGLNGVKEILAEPAVGKITARLEGFDASQFDQAIEEVQNTPEEDLPAFKAGVYTNEAGSMAFVMDVGEAEDEEQMNMVISVLEDSSFFMHMEMANQGKVDYSVKSTGEIEMNMTGDANGMPMAISLVGQASDTGFEGALTISLVGAPLATVSMKIVAGGELTADVSAEGKKAVNATELKGDGTSEAAQGLLSEVSTVGFANVISAASAAMPEAVNTLMSLLTSGAGAD